MDALLFELAQARYALAITYVREVVRAVWVDPLPQWPSVVAGVINCRGTVIPVIDTRSRLDLPPKPVSPEDHFVIAENSLVSATAEVLAATTQQSAGAHEQAAAVAQTVTTVNEVVQTTEQAAERARTVADTAQDEESSVVFGMPKAAIEVGLTTMVLPLPQIAARLAQLSRVERSKGRT